jgi:hypothetical protein
VGSAERHGAWNAGPQAQRFHLAEHVYACETRDYVVLLDIKRNEFLGARAAQIHALGVHVQRANERSRAGPLDEPQLEEVSALFDLMQSQGMLTNDAVAHERHIPPPIECSLYPGFVPFRAKTEWRHMRHAAAAWFGARRALRRNFIPQFLERSHRRAASCGHGRPEKKQHLQRLFSAFAHCRALLYTASGECLLDSLAVHDFLSRFGIASSLVVGVRTCPFSAHAWIQVGPCVVNDIAEIVRAYEPIFVSAPGSHA